jgi:hypothetical protein
LVAERKTSSNLRQLMTWSSRYRWVERAELHDDFQERLARRAREKDRIAMLDRHARLGMLGQSLALDSLRKRLQEAQEDPTKTLSTQDATRLLDVSVKVERLARGEPTLIANMGSSADRPLRMTVQQTAQEAIEGVLGLCAPLIERIETAEAEGEAQPEATPNVPDPFADLPPAEEPTE